MYLYSFETTHFHSIYNRTILCVIKLNIYWSNSDFCFLGWIYLVTLGCSSCMYSILLARDLFLRRLPPLVPTDGWTDRLTEVLQEFLTDLKIWQILKDSLSMQLALTHPIEALSHSQRLFVQNRNNSFCGKGPLMSILLGFEPDFVATSIKYVSSAEFLWPRLQREKLDQRLHCVDQFVWVQCNIAAE